ncbi:MAG: hypothetical protein ACTSPD_05145 [Promethearchaeota archaeon]
MILQTLTYIDIVIITLWILVVAVLASAGVLFIKKAKEKSKRIKIYLIAIGIFFILYSINRFIFFLHEFLFDPPMWTISLEDYNKIMVPDNPKFERYNIIWRVATAIGSIGLLIFLIGFESQILEKKSYFILSIIQGITLTLSLIIGPAADRLTYGRYILYFGLLPALAVPFLYFYLAYKASGNTRKRAIGAGLGFLIFYLGVAANSSAGKSVLYFLWQLPGLQLSYLIYGILCTIGLITYFKSIQY